MKRTRIRISHRRRPLDGAPSKKEFEAFAKILCRNSASGKMVDDFANYFEQVNPRFNRQVFVGAVLKCQKGW